MVAQATTTITAYHATNGLNAPSILKEGLKPSTNGRLGPGVYLATDPTVAETIGMQKGMALILKCTIKVRARYDMEARGPSTTWAKDGYNCARAMHPPWAGVAVPFEEYCVIDPDDIEIIRMEGDVKVSPPSYRFVNVGTRGFLDSHGQGVWLWGDGVNIGGAPDNITWQLRPVPGERDHHYVTNKAHDKYLDSHGSGTWLWGQASSCDVGQAPKNIQWRLMPVGDHMPDTFYIVHNATGFYLDGNPRYRDAKGVMQVRLWDSKGKGVGAQPRFIQWERKAC